MYTSRIRDLGTAEPALQAGAQLGEGPRWDARARRLLWVDIDGCALHLFEPATGADRTVALPDRVGAAAPTADERVVLVALADRLARVDVGTGALEPLVDVPHGRPGMRTNDGACDPAGRFWIGSMADDGTPRAGALYRYDGALETVIEDVSLSNGLGWTADGRLMYFIDSPEQRVEALDFDVTTGAVSGRRPFAEIPEEDGTPDGLAVDDEGGIWVALYGGAQVRRFDPDGRLDAVLRVPAHNVTACCFVGDRLYVTTAQSGEPLGGSLFRADVGVSGPPARVFGRP